MFRTKLGKGLILSLSLTVLFSTATFAEEAESQEVKIQIEQVAGETKAIPEPAPDSSVSNEVRTAVPVSVEEVPVRDGVSDAMYKKQIEVDVYLFEKHKDEIAAKGITVTHSVATNEFVEIGITPYSDEYAEFLYQALGKEQIKVVEGIPAVAYELSSPGSVGEGLTEEELMYTTGLPVDEELMSTTGLPVDENNVVLSQDDIKRTLSATAESAPASQGAAMSATVISIVAAAVLILLGGAVLFTRRMKAASK